MQVDDIKNIGEKSKKIIQSFSPEVKKFYQFHGIQMLGSQMPIELVETLYKKLVNQIYDAGTYLEINDNQESETFQVRAKEQLPAAENIFLVDHALTFKYNNLRTALKQNPSIIPRLQAILKYSSGFKDLGQATEFYKQEETKGQITEDNENNQVELQFDSMQLSQIGHLDFPANTITLSLMNNNLSEQKVDEIISKLQYLNLKVLWINENPVQNSQKLRQYINTKTKIQIFNSKFTKNCGVWGLKYAHNRKISFANNPLNEEVYELNLDDRDIFKIENLNAFQKFNNLSSLSIKGHTIEEEDNKKTILWLLKELPSLKNLYVDPSVQAWLFKLVEDKQIDLQIANRILVNKHSLLLHPVPEEVDYEIDEITKNLFKICGCYRLASTEQLDQDSTWYVNDEVGSMIPHSDNPNIKIIPFLYVPNNQMDSQVQAFSIMWPIKDIKSGQLLFKDYLNGMKQNHQRSSRLGIWYELPQHYYSKVINQYNNKMFELQKNSVNVLQEFYKQNAISQRQYLAKMNEDDSSFPESHAVITDHEFVQKYLKHDKFKIVEDIEQATIIWLTSAADEEQWKKFKGKYFLNQFPFESAIVMKHNLADTIQSIFGDTKFLMRTYNLQTQIKQFIGDYYQRESKAEDNLWIIKPPNMARSMDMIITDNLPDIIKSMETGPKIAQKYITNPVLRQGRKVDLRYVLLVKSVSPLRLYLYKHFWIRSSNNPYTTDRRALSNYQTQFTVMNYGKVSDFKQIPYKQFISDFQQTYKPVQWSTIHEKIKKMLRNTFIACGKKYPQMQDDKCRALYGIDIMVDQQTMEPKLLEMTFSPDCKRACEYYLTFYDEVFETLFSDNVGQNMERII